MPTPEGTWAYFDTPDQSPVLGIWSADPRHVRVIGSAISVIYRDGGLGAEAVTSFIGPKECVTGTGRDDVWIGGAGSIWHNDVGEFGTGAAEYLACTSLAPGVALFAGSPAGQALRVTLDGGVKTVEPMAGNATVLGLTHLGTGEIWATGDGARVWSRQASGGWNAPQQVDASGRTGYSVAGTSPTDVWVVGSAGLLAHFDGGAWTPLDAGRGISFAQAYATATNDVWFVGTANDAHGRIVHWNGCALVAANGDDTTANQADFSGSDYFAVWAVTPNDVWAGNSDGGLVRMSR